MHLRPKTAIKFSVLYISLDSGFSGALLASQILPHIKDLSLKGLRFYIISFEPGQLSPLSSEFFEAAKRSLDIPGVKWWALNHIRGPSPIPSIFAIVKSLFVGSYIVVRHRIDILHGRSLMGGIVALCLNKLWRRPWVFDPRILHAEGAVIAGHCDRDSKRFRFLYWLERMLSRKADGVRVESFRHRDAYLDSPESKKRGGARYHLVVNGVDLDEFERNTHISPYPKVLPEITKRNIIAYSGNFLHGRPNSAMIRFIDVYASLFGPTHFLVLTYSTITTVQQILKDHNFSFSVLSCPHEKVSSHLSIADVGIVFNDPNSCAHAVPLKFAEYLACGLPVVINAGLGNTQEILEKYRVGCVINEFSHKSLELAAEFVHNLLNEKDIRERCRYACKRELAIETASSQLFKLYKYASKTPNNSRYFQQNT